MRRGGRRRSGGLGGEFGELPVSGLPGAGASKAEAIAIQGGVADEMGRGESQDGTELVGVEEPGVEEGFFEEALGSQERGREEGGWGGHGGGRAGRAGERRGRRVWEWKRAEGEAVLEMGMKGIKQGEGTDREVGSLPLAGGGEGECLEAGIEGGAGNLVASSQVTNGVGEWCGGGWHSGHVSSPAVRVVSGERERGFHQEKVYHLSGVFVKCAWTNAVTTSVCSAFMRLCT